MAHFKDRSGRKWSIGLDSVTVETIRTGLAVDLTQRSEYDRLGDELGLTFAVLWWLCRRQATSRGIDRDAFFAIIAGCIDPATACLVNCAKVFIPSDRAIVESN